MSHHKFNPEHLALTRREFLSRCGMGMGALSLGALLSESLSSPAQAASTYTNPLAALALLLEQLSGLPRRADCPGDPV